MAFPRHLLNDDEELVLDLRPHWVQLLVPGAAATVAVIVGLLVIVGWNPGGAAGSVLKIVMGLAVLAALAWFGWCYLVWSRTMFVLTSDRIVTRAGVLSKSGVEFPLERINTVFFRQSVFERMVRSGDLAIESASERGTETLSNIRNPSIVQKEIYVQMEHNERRMRQPQYPAPSAPGSGRQAFDPTTELADTTQAASIPEQIERLAELHQRGLLSDAEYQQKKTELLDRM